MRRTLKELNKEKKYTAKQLSTLAKFKNKYLNVYPFHYDYYNEKTTQYETVYEVRGTTKEIKENYQSVDEILS